MVDSMEYNAKKYPIIHLYEEWELSPNIIKTLITCGITNKAILRQMHQHDLNDIFPKRSQIGDKIFFRCKLQAWREEYRNEDGGGPKLKQFGLQITRNQCYEPDKGD
uniref:Uncharacterized protein n=1 Tax=Lutzomyia longipalpis TaxID=7200 RepID=A0A1B0CBY6_LUTLO